MATTHRKTSWSKSADIKIISIPDIDTRKLKVNITAPEDWLPLIQLSVMFNYNTDHLKRLISRAVVEGKIERRVYFVGGNSTYVPHYNIDQIGSIVKIRRQKAIPYNMFNINQLMCIFDMSRRYITRMLRKNNIKPDYIICDDKQERVLYNFHDAKRVLAR